MALIDCPECGNKVSNRAPHCPSCGVPITAVEPVNPRKPQILTVQETSKRLKVHEGAATVLSLIGIVFLLLWVVDYFEIWKPESGRLIMDNAHIIGGVLFCMGFVWGRVAALLQW